MMNPEIKALWIEELESNRWTQGVGALVRVVNGQEQHCCLGVLCEVLIAHPEFGIVVARDDEGGEYRTEAYTAVNQHTGYTACELAGLEDMGQLYGWNDSARWSFKRIAAELRRDDRI